MKMNTKIWGTLVLLAVLVVEVVLMSGCTQKAEEKSASEEATATTSTKKELTAREAFRIALPKAQEWSSDAALMEITNYMGSKNRTDGRAAVWTFEFGSSGAKRLEVYVRKGEVSRTLKKNKYVKEDAIIGEWIDSPEAMDIALKHCGEEPVKNYWLGLSTDLDGTISWVVQCQRNKGPVMVDINALTGEVIETR